MDIKLIFGVISLHFLALVTPGPDFVLAVRNSLQFGRKMGLMTALGFGLGMGLHVSYSIAGLALLLKEFPTAYHLVRYAGASYLIWIGVSVFWSLRKGPTAVAVLELNLEEKKTARECFSQGFLTNILNPKATLFILGIYTSVIPPETPLLTLVVAGILMVIMTILWFTIVAWFFGLDKVRSGYHKLEKVLNVVFATFFIIVGLTLFRD
jgi:RhtB (resistance to homoserine/threonine) family protein